MRGRGDALERVVRGEALELPNDLVGAGGEVGHFWTHRLPDMRGDSFHGYFFIATNVTEARRAEQRLRELNSALQQADAFARLVADNIPGRITYWDDEMRCRFVNQVHCDWLGIPREVTLGHTALETRQRVRLSVRRNAIGRQTGSVPDSTSAPPEPTTMLSILLLDDEPNLLSARSRTLRSHLDTAVRVETCSDPHEALARVGANDFDVIVFDSDMASMNSIEFLHLARELQPEALRVLVVTPSAIGASTAAIDALGVFRCIVAPWSAERLVEDVPAALAQAVASRAERELAAAVRAASGGVGGFHDAGPRIDEFSRK